MSYFDCSVELDVSFGLYLMQFTQQSTHICCQGYQHINSAVKKIVKTWEIIGYNL